MKTATTQTPVLDVIKNRWSARAFADKPISDAMLQQLFEAASWAPSSMNAQPWRYIYAHRSDTEAFNAILDCLLPGNHTWAKNAAVLIIAGSKAHFDNGHDNRHARYDLGAANTNLMLEATANGIYGHVMGGYDLHKAKAIMNDEDVEPEVIIALGYLGEAATLEEPFRTRETTPRTRKNTTEFAQAFRRK